MARREPPCSNLLSAGPRALGLDHQDFIAGPGTLPMSGAPDQIVKCFKCKGRHRKLSAQMITGSEPKSSGFISEKADSLSLNSNVRSHK